MSEPWARPSVGLLASLTGILVLAECGLAAIGYLSWSAAVRYESATAEDMATLSVLGPSATLGAVICLLVTIALARRGRGHGLARLAAGLAWLRLVGVLLALTAIGLSLGLSAVVGPASVLAVGDSLLAFMVTGVAVRKTRQG